MQKFPSFCRRPNAIDVIKDKIEAQIQCDKIHNFLRKLDIKVAINKYSFKIVKDKT